MSTENHDPRNALYDMSAQILRDLVRIPSVNPSLVPDGQGETEIADFICGLMKSWGLEVLKRPVAPRQFNAIGIMRGSGGGRTLLFNGHMDTVTVEGMSDPYSGEIRDGKLYGRGAIDMKAGLAATLAATHALVTSGTRLRGDVIFSYVADEEYASLGTEQVVADIRAGRLARPDAVVNTEPSGVRVAIAHKGFTWFEIETFGKAAHGSRPDLGNDAIVKMGRVLAGLENLQKQLEQGRRHPLLGTGSVHASLIQGGRELSSYPDYCKLQIERRTVPSETKTEVLGQIEEILENEKQNDPNFESAARSLLARNPWQADVESEIVHALMDSVEQVMGRAAETVAMSGWLDSSLLADAGIPAVIFGPKGEGLHALEEWADLESVATCAQVYKRLMETYCA